MRLPLLSCYCETCGEHVVDTTLDDVEHDCPGQPDRLTFKREPQWKWSRVYRGDKHIGYVFDETDLKGEGE